MIIFINLFLYILSVCIPRSADGRGLTAISSEAIGLEFYKRIKDEDTLRLKFDLALADPSGRHSVCSELAQSGYFALKDLNLVDMKPSELLTRLSPDNEDIFSRIWARKRTKTSTIPKEKARPSPKWLRGFRRAKSSSESDFEYQNLFAPRAFTFRTPKGQVEEISEEVFVCLLEDQRHGTLHPYYVSKKYKVPGTSPTGGRFLFAEHGRETAYGWVEILLAEEPAEVYEGKRRTDFDVEIKYLARRRDRSPAIDDLSDPVCKLLSQNQESRLCAVVMTSSYFVQASTPFYPQRRYSPTCVEIEVSFESDVAKNIAAGKEPYKERAVPCPCANVKKNHERSAFKYFYISWAYAPNEVFVYEEDFHREGRIYLKNWTFDVNLVNVY